MTSWSLPSGKWKWNDPRGASARSRISFVPLDAAPFARINETVASRSRSRAEGRGGPELLPAVSLPLAASTSSQVQLEVAAVAVNPVDLTTRAGRNIPESDARFPMVLGRDVAGTVAAIGSDVTDWQVGDRVAAMVFQPLDQSGVHAQYVNLEADLLARVPQELGLQQAATVPLAGLTASQLLDEGLSQGARTLLVDGPLGAVGRTLVALAVRGGLEVVGVVRPDQTDDLLALGATAVQRGAFADAVRRLHPTGVDAAIDLVGGTTAHQAFAAVKDGGRYATAVPPYIDPSGPFDVQRDIKVHVRTVHPHTGRLTGRLLLLP